MIETLSIVVLVIAIMVCGIVVIRQRMALWKLREEARYWRQEAEEALHERYAKDGTESTGE